MFSKYSLTKATCAERHIIRQQWQRNGQCLRCFHASLRHRVDEEKSVEAANHNNGRKEDNDHIRSYNQPPRRPTRYQRAEMISEEVRMLNQPNQHLSIDGQNNNFPIQSRVPNAVDDVWIDTASDRDKALVQGASMHIAQTDQEGSDVKKPSRDGQDIEFWGEDSRTMLTADKVSLVEEEEEEEEEEEDESIGEDEVEDEDITDQPDMVTGSDPSLMSSHIRSRLPPRLQPPGIAFAPPNPDISKLVSSGNGTATIADNNFIGVLSDRIRVATEAGMDQNPNRTIQYMVGAFKSRQLVHFSSREERDAVTTEYRRSTVQNAPTLSEQEKTSLGADAAIAKSIERRSPFLPLRPRTKEVLIDSVVKGIYDKEGLIARTDGNQQGTVDNVKRLLARNGTYLLRDNQTFVEKIKTLLPSASPGHRRVQQKRV